MALDKTELLNRFSQDPEERVVLARVLDHMERTRTRSIPSATAFLSPAQRAAAEPLLNACGHPKHLFWGGYPEAERTVCIFLPDWLEEEEYLQGAGGGDGDADTDTDGDSNEGPLGAIQASFPESADLTHRDLLGGLMGIGLTRERLGDILVQRGSAQIVCLAETVPILLQQFEKAGRAPLKCRAIPLSELKPAPAEIRRIKDTVANLRLDAVLATGFSLSRGKASELISAGRVSLNHRECLKGDKPVQEGDIITCRGLGKCVLKQVGGLSKKGRIGIEMERYL